MTVYVNVHRSNIGDRSKTMLKPSFSNGVISVMTLTVKRRISFNKNRFSLLNLDYYDTYSAFRFSPLDVNSRESACLTNFLLSGKCVLLELGNLPSECTVNINEYGEEKNLNTSETDGTSSNNNRLFSHMIISHNQELMIHAIAFGSNNPMSKIGPSYVVTNENETNLSLNELEEYMEEIDDENLEKDLRVDVKTCSFLFLELICF